MWHTNLYDQFEYNVVVNVDSGHQHKQSTKVGTVKGPESIFDLGKIIKVIGSLFLYSRGDSSCLQTQGHNRAFPYKERLESISQTFI